MINENIIKDLQAYVNSDEIYQKYKNKQLKEISDSDRLHIKHCDDIEELIREYECLYMIYKDKQRNSSDINVGSIQEAIEILKNAIRCNEKQFEELGTHILLQDDEEEAIKIVLGNLEALCDMQRSADRELENAEKINNIMALVPKELKAGESVEKVCPNCNSKLTISRAKINGHLWIVCDKEGVLICQ